MFTFKKSIAGISILSVLLTSCWSPSVPATKGKGGSKAKFVQTQTIKLAPFSKESKLIGQIQLRAQTPVSPLVSGTLKTINVEVWQKVSEGDVIATIDLWSSILGTTLNTANTSLEHANQNYEYAKTSSNADLQSALTQLQTAQTNHDNTYASTDEQLKTAQIQLSNIKTQADQTNVSLSESIKSAKITVDLAQKLADNAQLSLDNFNANSKETLSGALAKQNDLYSSAHVSLKSLCNTIKNSLTQIDVLFWITNSNKEQSDSYQVYLGAKDSSIRNDIETGFNDAFNSYNNLNTETQALNSYSQTDTAITDMINILNKVVALTQKSTDYLNESVTSSNFTQTQLTALQTTISSLQNTFQTQLASIVSLQNSITDTNNSLSSTRTNLDTGKASLETALQITQTQLTSAKQTLVSAQAGNLTSMDTLNWNVSLSQSQLQSTITAIKTSRDQVDNTLKAAKENYNSVQAKLASQLVTSKNQVDSSKGQADIAKTQYQNWFIKAPFSWVILQKNAEVWQAVNSGTPIVTIWNTNESIIKLNVNASITPNIRLWDTVNIESWSWSFTWTISLISPSLNSQTQLTDIEVSFPNENMTKFGMRLWDYINVYITNKAVSSKSILVPFQAVIAGDQGNFMVFTVDKKNIAHLTSVKLWDKNSTMVEITDGLKENDKVVIVGTLNINDWDMVKDGNKPKN